MTKLKQNLDYATLLILLDLTKPVNRRLQLLDEFIIEL